MLLLQLLRLCSGLSRTLSCAPGSWSSRWRKDRKWKTERAEAEKTRTTERSRPQGRSRTTPLPPPGEEEEKQQLLRTASSRPGPFSWPAGCSRGGRALEALSFLFLRLEGSGFSARGAAGTTTATAATPSSRRSCSAPPTPPGAPRPSRPRRPLRSPAQQQRLLLLRTVPLRPSPRCTFSPWGPRWRAGRAPRRSERRRGRA